MANFEDDNHAYRTGMLAGILTKKGIRAKSTVDDNGDYAPIICIDLPLDEETGTFVPVYVRVLASEGFE